MRLPVTPESVDFPQERTVPGTGSPWDRGSDTRFTYGFRGGDLED